MLHTSDTIRSTETPDGRILLDVRHGQMFSVNAVGSKILDLLERGQDESSIVEEISRLYVMDVEIVRRDVREFIEALSKSHIVRTAGSVASR
jgi:Coenzyme PQQ synthesis protein D (PqqD)